MWDKRWNASDYILDVWCASSATHAGCCIGLHQSQNKVLGNQPFVTPHYTNICKFPAVCNGSANCRCLGTQTNEERQTVDRTSLSLHSQSSVSHTWCFPVGKVTGCSQLTHTLMVTCYLGQTATVPTLPFVSTIRVQQTPYIVYPRVLQCISVPKF